MPPLRNLRVRNYEPLPTPGELLESYPATQRAVETVGGAREAVRAQLAGEDERLLVIVGPCSIHDLDMAREYSASVGRWREEHQGELHIIMRVYFEKPRTTVGWKGLINDPALDGGEDVPRGVRLARSLLAELNDAGIPCATELLDPTVPQYIADLVSWAAIGARTTESQTHREMASGLSMPVGFKNGTDGTLETALAAIRSAAHSHSFVGLDDEGRACVVRADGNPDCHLVLRGGKSGPNYDAESVQAAYDQLKKKGSCTRTLIDCSHANSKKDYKRQGVVARDVADRVAEGDDKILGVMLESNLAPGKQNLAKLGPAGLAPGVSITDGCIGLTETGELLAELASAVRRGR